jgi:hypothetical protein
MELAIIVYIIIISVRIVVQNWLLEYTLVIICNNLKLFNYCCISCNYVSRLLFEYSVASSEWELRSESLHESFLNSHAPVKREQELHESCWESRVCTRVFSTLIRWSDENKSCMRVVEKREFARESSQLSYAGQTRTRVAWELRSESLHESFLNSHGRLVKREQELHESWWELRSESLHESFLNSRALVKREQELHESWWELRSENSHQNLNQFKVDESAGSRLRIHFIFTTFLHLSMSMGEYW